MIEKFEKSIQDYIEEYKRVEKEAFFNGELIDIRIKIYAHLISFILSGIYISEEKSIRYHLLRIARIDSEARENLIALACLKPSKTHQDEVLANSWIDTQLREIPTSIKIGFTETTLVASLFRVIVLIESFDRRLSISKKTINSLYKMESELFVLENKLEENEKLGYPCFGKELAKKISDALEKVKQKHQFILGKFQCKREKDVIKLYDSYGNELESKNNQYFQYFENFIKIHYSKFNSEKITQIIEEKEGKGTSYVQIHAKIQYYKKKNKEEDLLKTEKEINTSYKFNKKNEKDPEKNEYEEVSYKINLNYIKNSILSCYIRNLKEFSIQDFVEKINDIEEFQDTNKIKDYYPYLIVLERFLNEIEDQLQRGKPDLSLIAILATQAKELKQKANKNLSWCRENCFVLFRLSFDECLIKNHNLEYPLFCSSSYILPIDFDEVEERLRELEQRIYTQEFEYKLKIISKEILEKTNQIHSNLKNEVELGKQEVERAKQEVDKKLDGAKIDYIAVLSIFGAISFFTAGSTNILLDITNAHLVIGYMGTLGSVLAIFAFVILLVLHKGMDKEKTGYIWIASIAAICVAISHAFISSYSKDSENILRSSADTVIQKLKPDSILRHEIDILLHKKIDSLPRLNQPDSKDGN